jgi:hypothetical protein
VVHPPEITTVEPLTSVVWFLLFMRTWGVLGSCSRNFFNKKISLDKDSRLKKQNINLKKKEKEKEQLEPVQDLVR